MKHFLLPAFCITISLLSNAQLLAIKYTDLGSQSTDQDNFWYWQEWGQNFYTYNGSCNLESDLFKWTGGDGIWHDGDKTLYYYNGNNQSIKELHLLLNPISGQWDSSSQILKEYDNNGRLMINTIQTFINGNWQNDTRISRTYNQKKLDSTLLEEKWEQNAWKKYLFTTNAYDERDSLELVSQKVFNGSAVDSGKTRFTYSYDSLNRIDSILAETWDTDHWRNF